MDISIVQPLLALRGRLQVDQWRPSAPLPPPPPGATSSPPPPPSATSSAPPPAGAKIVLDEVERVAQTATPMAAAPVAKDIAAHRQAALDASAAAIKAIGAKGGTFATVALALAPSAAPPATKSSTPPAA